MNDLDPHEPLRRSYSREEMIAEAHAYVNKLDSSDIARKYERLGLLVDFIHECFPANVGEYR